MSTTTTTTGFEIAVIGMAGRFPGAKDIQQFQENLEQGIESISFLDHHELQAAGVPAEHQQLSQFVRAAGGLLADKEYFDAAFFGYTPVEAEIMDPQMRIFHQYVWSALEDAGYDSLVYPGAIGLYGGATSNREWEALTWLSGKNAQLGALSASHLTDKDFMISRIAYKLNLKGPALVVQSACSTSLVAIHLACRALLMGECEMALAGGITIKTKLQAGYLYQEGLVKSPDGHCRAFDARAAGFIGGSGVGVVLLKRLKHAQTAHDHIYAVIKGSAVNNDGLDKIGYTAPGVTGQVTVIKTALHVAKVDPTTITYVEAHGSATPMGDPVEVEALKQAFNTTKKQFCALGSVKTNIGHLDAAAGVAGFIKTVLALYFRRLPPSLHFEKANPAIDFAHSPFYVNTSLREWKNEGLPLRAGVNSLGIGGTNAHVILEEWRPAPTTEENATQKPQLLVLSAQTAPALTEAIHNLAHYLPGKTNLNDVAYTLQTGRHPFKYRRKFVCTDIPQAIAALSTAAQEEQPVAGTASPTVIFMFTGLGAQYERMGFDLYQSMPLFRATMDHCFALLKPLMGYDVKEILYPQGTGEHRRSITDPDVAQPVIFMIQYALTQVLKELGITPWGMIGYSFGEYTAACLSGVLSVEDTLRLIVKRGQLMRNTPLGGMLSVPLPLNELLPLLPAELDIAINNGPSCIVAGPAEILTEWENSLKKQRLLCMALPTLWAVHSRLMKSITAEFTAFLEKITFNKPVIPYISNVTGYWIKPGEVTTPLYWVQHLQQTVCFDQGIRELCREKNAVFLEIGPARDLSTLIQRYMGDNPTQYTLNLLRHPKTEVHDERYFLHKIGELWQRGVPVHCPGLHQEHISGTTVLPQRIPLPTYPFARDYFWIEGDAVTYATTLAKKEQKEQGDDNHYVYLPVWQQTPLLSKPGAANGTNCTNCTDWWLVFTPLEETPERLLNRFTEYGHPIIVVKPGTHFQKQTATDYRINPHNTADYTCLLHALQEDDHLPKRILHLWGMINSDENDSKTCLHDTLAYGFYSLLYLLQAFTQESTAGDLAIVAITSDVMDITGNEAGAPGKAALVGLLKVIPQEYPHIACRFMDVEAGAHFWADPWMVEQVYTEITLPFEQEIGTISAYRGRFRWVLTYQPITLSAQAIPSWPLKEQGVYLLTGGLGNIGYVLAGFLAQHYRAKLVLTGRSAIDENHEKIVKLRKMGATVLYYQADVADFQAMSSAVSAAEANWGPIQGVIHTAGLIAGPSITVLRDLAKPLVDQQFQAKAEGFLVLAALFGARPLDFCWLMSSIAAVLGGLQFAAYAASNNVLDAYVHRYNRQNHHGYRWLVVNWDALKPTATGPLCQQLLNLPMVDQVVLSSHGALPERLNRWIKLETLHTAAAPLYEKKANKTLLPRPELLIPYEAPRDEVETQLAGLLQDLFGFKQIGIFDDFFELGGDSIKAVTLIYRINTLFHLEMPLPEFFNRRTIEQVALYINQARSQTAQTPEETIPPAEKRDYYPLSSAQKRFYFIYRLDPHSIAYNSRQILQMEGEPDPERLNASFHELIMRHEALRTTFHLCEGEPVQCVHDTIPFTLEIKAASAKPLEEVVRDFIRPFALETAPLLRAGLVPIAQRHYLFIVDMHHIISDGVSHEILVQDFLAFYTGKGALLAPMRLHYKDYCLWQHARQDKLHAQATWWLERFAGELPVLDIPTDFPRPPRKSMPGDGVDFQVPGTLTSGLRQLAQKNGTTLFVVLLTVYNVLLYRLSRQEDIIVGTLSAGRHHANLERIIGIFLESLALRNFPNGNVTFRDFLHQVSIDTFKAFENQDYHYEELIEKVVKTRETSRNPLYDVVLVLQNYGGMVLPQQEETGMHHHGLLLKPYSYNDKTAPTDMTFYGVDEDATLAMKVRYCTALFKEETIQRFIGYFLNIIQAVVTEPGQTLANIEMLSSAERHWLLYTLNEKREPVSFPGDKTIYHQFIDQVGKTRDNIALVGESNDSQDTVQLSYGYLAALSASGAQVLLTKGKTQLVALLLERTIETIATILAVSLTGAAYLPIDPHYPAERILYILKDSAAQILVTTTTPGQGLKETLTNLPDFTLTVIDNNDMFKRRPGLSFPVCQARGEDIAYVIYTSGSTGKPKGVLIEHRNVLSLLCQQHMEQLFEFTSADTWSMFHSYCFDFSVWEMYGPLFYGGKLLLIGRAVSRDFRTYLTLLKKHQVTVLNQTPSAFYLLAEEELKNASAHLSLRYVIFGGESLAPGRLREWFYKYPHTHLINMYGITETTVHVTFKEIGAAEISANRSFIGLALPSLTVHILDVLAGLVPTGSGGEICVSGAGVARGYLNRVEATADVFPCHPYWDNTRMYRSGDLGRVLSDGQLEYLGRSDFQVKIRGFRVELGEIENQLLQHRGIKESLVIAKKDGSGHPVLCAYVVSKPAWQWSEEMSLTETLKEFLANTLPEYMIPSYFVPLEVLPLTAHGKIDRLNLPEPAYETVRVLTPPCNDIEVQLVRIWSQILGIPPERIGTETDFAVLGGHSLGLIKLCAEIRKTFAVELSVMHLFEEPRIKDIARAIQARQQGDVLPINQQVLLLNQKQARHLFMFPPIIGYGFGFQPLAALLVDYSCYAFHFIEDEDRVAQYVNTILTIQQKGPYVLAGYSAGGNLAFAVAQCLERLGHRVSDLIILDTFRGGPGYSLVADVGNARLVESLTIAVDRLEIPFLKAEVIRKVQVYTHYIENVVNDGVVAANIHYIRCLDWQERLAHILQSAVKPLSPALLSWEKSTTTNFLLWDGAGNHRDVLTPGFLETNATIINTILKRIQEHKHDV